MRLNKTRAGTAVAVAIFVMIAAGCSGGEDQAPPEPDPGPRYEQIPEDLCDRVRVEEVAERFDLVMAPWYERRSRYSTQPTHWFESCRFEGRAEDGQFATELGDFEPNGSVQVETYHEVAEAVEAYDQEANNIPLPGGQQPGATTAEVAGWWDSGVSMEYAQALDPDYVNIDEDSKISSLKAVQLVRHENLVMLAWQDAVAPTEDVAEAFALLHELVGALIDEAVEHLSLTAE
jgi:hypothetical protein